MYFKRRGEEMSVFFIFEAGACLWLAIAGVLFAGMALEPRGGEGEPIDNGGAIIFVVLSVFCVGLVLVRAIIAWGAIALAAMIVLGCGLVAVFINTALNRINGHSWATIPISIVGLGTSLCTTVVVCVLIFSTVWDLKYEEYSYGTEIRELEYIHNGNGVHLVIQVNNGENYTFQYEHKFGDTFGNHRCILDESQVTWLDESDAEPYVEGELIAMAKIDPISGQPIETQNGKTFQPSTLYVSPTDVWVTDVNDYMD